MKQKEVKGKVVKVKTVKEPIRMRFKKLKDGSESIYFDIYRDGQRKYDFQKLYIVPERTEEDKEKNKETLKLATRLKNKMILDLESSEHGFDNKQGEKQKVHVITYINELAEKASSESMKYQYRGLVKQITEYKGTKITLGQITKDWCKGFYEYLRKKTTIEQGTKSQYSKLLTLAISGAVEDDYITNNPAKSISRKDKIKQPESSVEYLTIDEVKKLIETECTKEVVKLAFLFSCFSGLRYSDIVNLKWDDIKKDNDGEYYIKYQQEKTEKNENLQISKEAMKYVPVREEKENVFKLPQNGYTNQILAGWVLAAGIKKRVTFHVARHTNATLLLSAGVAIETVSKILGHSDIKTTQIYAKVIDEKKREAANILDKIMKEA